jgi:hypothetical protein
MSDYEQYKKELERKIQVMQAHLDGRQIERYWEAEDSWLVISTPVFNWYSNDYRVKELSKPSVTDVNLLPSWVNYLVKNKNGKVTGFEKFPDTFDEEFWYAVGGKVLLGINVYPFCSPGECDWKDSLVELNR